MDINSWWTWAISYEPTLSQIDVTSSKPAIAIDSYNESSDAMSTLEEYLSEYQYQLLVYRFAMHRMIVSSGRLNIAQLTMLYNNYNIGSYSGIVQSASNGPTSASKLIPQALQNGDASSLLLWATPYGQEVEAIFEQLKNIAIVA